PLSLHDALPICVQRQTRPAGGGRRGPVVPLSRRGAVHARCDPRGGGGSRHRGRAAARSAMTIADGPHEPVLAPVAARYAWWLGLPAHRTAERDVPPEQVWAMPVVLRMEKTRPPSRTSLLEAAASAALAVCLDDEARPGGAWYEPLYTWTSGHIRKVARRARGAHWEAVQRLPGVTVDVAGAQARALVPCRVGDLPREVARLQISGSDLPADDPGPPPDDRPVLLLNP